MEIKKKFDEIASKLYRINDSMIKDKALITQRENSAKSLTEKIDSIIQLQSKEKQLNFKIFGKNFKCSKSLIVDSHFPNSIQCLVNNSEDPIVLYKNYSCFKIFISILELKSPIDITNTLLTKEKVLKELRFYFEENVLLNILGEIPIRINGYPLNSDDPINKAEYITSYEITSTTGNVQINENLEKYRAKSIYDILNVNDNITHAIFVSTRSNLILKFAKPIIAKTIGLKPFWGNLDHWFPGDGSNLGIYSSQGGNWTFIGTIPNNYGSNIEDIYYITVPSKTVFTKLKIEVRQYMLSIAYIEITN